MNKSIPLWLVVILILIALLPTVYFLGVQHGAETSGGTISKPEQTTSTVQSSTIPGEKPPNHPAVPENFTHFRVGNRNVKAMLVDGDAVWVGTSGGIVKYDIKKDDYQLYDVNNKSLLSNGVFHLNKLGEKLLVGTYGGGLSVYDKASNQWSNINIPQGLADQFVYDSKLLPNGDLWIATWSGVNRVTGARLDDKESWTTYDMENTNGGLPNDWVYGVEADNEGALWFATEKGVARFKDGKWKNWQHEQGLGADYELVEKDIQFKSNPSAASRHHAKQSTEQGFERAKVAYNPNYVVSLKVTEDGTVWAGTWGGGLARFDGKQWKNYTMKDGLPSNHIFTIYQDQQNQFWVGTSHGLAKMDRTAEKFTVYTKKNGLFADNVFSLDMADDGALWVGSFGGVSRLTALP